MNVRNKTKAAFLAKQLGYERMSKDILKAESDDAVKRNLMFIKSDSQKRFGNDMVDMNTRARIPNPAAALNKKFQDKFDQLLRRY